MFYLQKDSFSLFLCLHLTDNPAYRRASDGIILSGSDIKRGSIYSDRFPTNPPPRPPAGSKRGSLNGQVNPALSLKEEYVTMNPLYEGQVVDHKDLERLNCSDFGVTPDQVVLDTRKDPEGNFNRDNANSLLAKAIMVCCVSCR